MKEDTTKFFNMIFAQMEIAINLKNIKNNKELGQVAFNNLFNLDGPKMVSKKPSEKSIFIANKLYKPFSEILDSIEAIENITVFMRSVSS